ncbi:MAG: Na+/H+ antiporter subunit E [Deinococcales bacterium]|nr:Na+/H+ antiporter subunit E [Deinococcales bacterium]
MTRLVPHPWLSVALLATWLLMWQSVAPTDVLTGLLLALLLPRVLGRLDEPPATVKRPLVALRLFFTVLYDIAVSNVEVARLIVTGRQLQTVSGFVNIPLELRDRFGLAVLATIITSTPGTFWAAYNRRTNVVTIHVVDLKDEEATRALIKSRYERPLQEIFE